MKTKRPSPLTLQEIGPQVYAAGTAEAMVRTQVYLTRAEHEFLLSEAGRRDLTMAGVIRAFIDEKMSIPADAWANNPLLQPTVADPDYEGHEDGALNHDHYIYGCAKKYKKVRGKWVLKAENEP